MNKTVLILGANGHLGLAAASAFAADGWRVLAQTRRAFVPGMPASAQRVDAALEDADALVRAADGARAVVYAANPVYTQWQRHALPMARAGMAVAQRLNAVFMLPGNVYAFGASMPPLLTEDTPERPSNDKGEIRRDMEAEIAARTPRSIVVRAGDFFGAARGTWIDLAIAKDVRKGKLVYPGPPDVPHAWAYLPDFARCFPALAAREDLPAHARYHFPGHTLTGTELLDAIEHAAADLGITGPFGRGAFPWWALRALGWAVPMWREVSKMSYLWRVPHALDGTRLAATIGAVPHTPLHEAMRATLREIAV